MLPEFFIAKRYLFSKKSQNVINIISIISVVGVVVGTMGLIIVLSVFNGFSGLVISLYDSFDPDIKITAMKGKTFDPSVLDTSAIKKTEGVSVLSWSLEENALIKFSDRQFIGTIKGVDANFLKIAALNDKIVDGELILEDGNANYAIVGGGIAYSLSLVLNDPFNQLSIYIPKKGKPASILNPEEAFNISIIKPVGVFVIQQDFDSKYVLVPLRFAKEIIDSPNKVSSLEIGLTPGSDEEEVRDKIKAAVGGDFKVETRLQQHEFLYRILKTEKWAVYFILSFILVIAIFNIIGSLTMLIIEKKKDIGILAALGAENKMIKNIFLLEGILITMFGALVGITLGGIICFVQQKFGIIKLDNSESFLINAYPVEMQVADFFYVLGIVFAIGFLAAWYASSKISAHEQISLLKSAK